MDAAAAIAMRNLPDYERERLIILGTLTGVVVDGRKRFEGRRAAA